MGLTRLTATSLRPARCCLERSRTMTVRAPCGTVVVMVTGSLGERIAAYRRRRGLSQATLAGLVGRSESWLSQVERGIRSVDRLSVLLDLARVLRVDVEALLGRPWQYAPRGYSADRTTADQRLARDAPLAGGPGSAGYHRLRAALA